MFIANIHGKEEINKLALSKGLKAGETHNQRSTGYAGKPGLMGNTFTVKDQLKAAGAKWDGLNKAWVLESWDQLVSALEAI